MLVRFSCGCIGLTNVPGDSRPVILEPCDLPSDMSWEPMSLYRRDMGDKDHAPLGVEQTLELLEEIGLLMAEGYKFRQMLTLLGR